MQNIFNVSVIITTYNRHDLVTQTIEAVLAQTLPPLEIIVIDDGSTDQTEAAVRRYPVRYNRIVNSGPNMARAAGFGISRGDWIAFCDDDDLWKPNYLQTMSRYLVGDIRFGFANHVAIENGVWGQTDKFSQAPDGYFTTIGDSFYPSLLRWVPLLPSTSIVAADRLREAGGFDQDFGRGLSQDWELELRCVQQGPVAIVPEPLVGIRRHGGNRTNRQLASLLGDIRVLEFARFPVLGRDPRTFYREMHRGGGPGLHAGADGYGSAPYRPGAGPTAALEINHQRDDLPVTGAGCVVALCFRRADQPRVGGAPRSARQRPIQHPHRMQGLPPGQVGNLVPA